MAPQQYSLCWTHVSALYSNATGIRLIIYPQNLSIALAPEHPQVHKLQESTLVSKPWECSVCPYEVHTPHSQVHHYQSQALKSEKKRKPQLIKPLRKHVVIDASISILHIPVVQRWRDLQARQKEINQLNRPFFVPTK